MNRVLAILTLQILAFGSLAGCAPPGASPAESGGPTFIQMPLNEQALVGATPQLLESEFGQPALLRVDGTAQVWLYHAPDCGLNLILYPDNAGTPRVAMAAPTDDGADTAACSAALQRAHADAGATAAAAAQPVVMPAAIEVSPPPQAAAPMPAPAAAPQAPATDDNGAATDGLERASSS